MEKMVADVDETQTETPVHMMTMEQIESLKSGDTTEPETTREPEAKEDVTETPEDKTEPVEPEPVKESEPEKSLDDIKAENERLKKKVEHQDKFFARQATEIGLYRKRSPIEQATELERIRDLYIDNPEEGERARLEYMDNELRAAKSEQDRNAMMFARTNYEAVQSAAPDIDTRLDSFVEMLREDGVDENTISEFKEMPYKFDTGVLINLHRRSQLKDENAALASKVAEYERQIEELKKKPNAMLEKIESAANKGAVTAKSAGATAGKQTSVPDKPIHMMSLDELKKFREAGG